MSTEIEPKGEGLLNIKSLGWHDVNSVLCFSPFLLSFVTTITKNVLYPLHKQQHLAPLCLAFAGVVLWFLIMILFLVVGTSLKRLDDPNRIWPPGHEGHMARQRLADRIDRLKTLLTVLAVIFNLLVFMAASIRPVGSTPPFSSHRRKPKL